MKRNTLLALMGLVILAAMTLALADPPETIVLENKRGAVTLPHKAHIDMGMTCKSCHHTLAGDNDMPTTKCTDCHIKEDTPSLKDMGHKNCLSCHKEADNKAKGAPTKCSACHKK